MTYEQLEQNFLSAKEVLDDLIDKMVDFKDEASELLEQLEQSIGDDDEEENAGLIDKIKNLRGMMKSMKRWNEYLPFV